MKPSPGLSSGGSRDRISLDCCGDWATLRSRQPRKYVTEYMKRPTKRLQVILKDPEYREIQRVARSRHMSIAEWVRQALDLARRRDPVGGVSKKLEVTRAAAQHDYPVSAIDDMLAEIEKGYGTSAHP